MIISMYRSLKIRTVGDDLTSLKMWPLSTVRVTLFKSSGHQCLRPSSQNPSSFHIGRCEIMVLPSGVQYDSSTGEFTRLPTPKKLYEDRLKSIVVAKATINNIMKKEIPLNIKDIIVEINTFEVPYGSQKQKEDSGTEE
ncbi:hypothetical protein MFLAVUS_010754 [Mucor flavus]|uniref:Uncharacterized protein n=1 Tax=Mucor flavus TaxID=439312 RepID=A0ABP9ZDK1_9FUNG